MLRHKIAIICFNLLRNTGCRKLLKFWKNSSLFEMEKVPKQVGQGLSKWSVGSSVICRCRQCFLFSVYPTSSIQGLPDLKFTK